MLSFRSGCVMGIYLNNLNKGRTFAIVYGILCRDLDELLQF